MSYGTPPIVTEDSCCVQLPDDLEGNMLQHPGFKSMEKREDGELWSVTTGSYNRYKAKMYMMASSIMNQIYFTRHNKPGELVRLIKGFFERVLEWERSVPPELQLESHMDFIPSEGEEGFIRQVFAIQALTLRISYDNLLIFLFRPLITIGSVSQALQRTRESSPACLASILATGVRPDRVPDAFLQVAETQCWTSATRTSLVFQRPNIRNLFSFSFPALHVGIYAFSAGVMLALLALSYPLSTRGDECKRGIARIIQFSRSAQLKPHMRSQMSEVLTDLMHAIAPEETKALIASPDGVKSTTESYKKPHAHALGPTPEMFPASSGGSQALHPPTCITPEATPHGDSDHGNSTTSEKGDEQQLQAHELDTGLTLATPPCQTSHMHENENGPSMCSKVHGKRIPSDTDPALQEMLSGSPYGDMGSAMDVWTAPHAEWLGDPLQGMNQVWMWNGTFSYH